jgi:pimeloyl-ACP methyl ester carboxylesterase
MTGPAGIHAESAGEGPAIVLVHAGICDGGMWDAQWRTLPAANRVVRFDMRGFGRSPVPSVAYSHARDLIAVMDAAGISEAAPARVSALVLVGSGLPGHEWSASVRDYWAAEEEAIERGDLAAAAEVNVRFWVDGPARRPEDVDAGVRRRAHAMQLRALELQVPAYEADGDLEELLVPDVGDRLGEVTQPALVLVGEADQPDIHAIAERLSAGLPRAHTGSLPHAAHLPNMERPGLFDELVTGFLSRPA